MDPSTLNVTQLKSELAKRGVKLPAGSRSKAFYTELYKSQILGEHDLKEPGTPVILSPNTPVSNRSSSRVKEPKKSEVKRDREDLARQIPFDEEEKPNKKKKSKNDTHEDSDQETDWRSYIQDPPGPDQIRLDDFVTINPTPKNSPPRKSLTPSKPDTLKQTTLQGDITVTPIALPMEQPEYVIPETGKQLTLDSFPVPKTFPKANPKSRHSVAPQSLDKLNQISGVTVTGTEREKRLNEERKLKVTIDEQKKEDSSRRKSTPIPDRKLIVDPPKPSRKSNFKGLVAKKVEEEVKSRKTTFFFLLVGLLLIGLVAYRYGCNCEHNVYSMSGKPFCDTPDVTKTLVYSGSSCVACPENGYCQLGKLADCQPNTVQSQHFAVCRLPGDQTEKVHRFTRNIFGSLTSGWFGNCDKREISIDIIGKTLDSHNVTEGRDLIAQGIKDFIKTSELDVGMRIVGDLIETVFPVGSIWCRFNGTVLNLIASRPFEAVVAIIALFVLFVLNWIAGQRQRERVEFEAIVSAAKTKIKELRSAAEPQVQELIKAERDFEHAQIDERWEEIAVAIREDPRIGEVVDGSLKTWNWRPSEDNLSKQLFE
jgi:hypothetical protein